MYRFDPTYTREQRIAFFDALTADIIADLEDRTACDDPLDAHIFECPYSFFTTSASRKMTG